MHIYFKKVNEEKNLHKNNKEKKTLQQKVEIFLRRYFCLKMNILFQKDFVFFNVSVNNICFCIHFKCQPDGVNRF